MNDATLIAAYSGAGTLLLTIGSVVCKALVRNIVTSAIMQQNKLISDRFDKLDAWQLEHLTRGHYEQPRRR
jgi:hypothetical protein